MVVQGWLAGYFFFSGWKVSTSKIHLESSFLGDCKPLSAFICVITHLNAIHHWLLGALLINQVPEHPELFHYIGQQPFVMFPSTPSNGASNDMPVAKNEIGCKKRLQLANFIPFRRLEIDGVVGKPEAHAPALVMHYCCPQGFRGTTVFLDGRSVRVRSLRSTMSSSLHRSQHLKLPTSP